MKSVAAFIACSIFACCSFVSVEGVSCYVCMGRDMDSCARGKTECPGYCYKVLDTTHDLISKGCADVNLDNKLKKEISDWSPEPHITLYWTNTDDRTKPREHVRGHTYFCDEDMCNAAPRNLVASGFQIFVMSLIGIFSFLWR